MIWFGDYILVIVSKIQRQEVEIICKILVKTKLFFVYNVTVFKIGCRFNKLENINKSYLKILKQQIWSKALEITFDLHNENSHGAANLLFRTQHNVKT